MLIGRQLFVESHITYQINTLSVSAVPKLRLRFMSWKVMLLTLHVTVVMSKHTHTHTHAASDPACKAYAIINYRLTHFHAIETG